MIQKQMQYPLGELRLERTPSHLVEVLVVFDVIQHRRHLEDLGHIRSGLLEGGLQVRERLNL